MINRRVILALSAALFFQEAGIGFAAKRPEPTGFAALLERVSTYLNSRPVRRARTQAAVAAVRGGIPTDQGEDLDQRLLDRAHLLRARQLAAAKASEEAALRKVYQALAVSQLAQSLEKPLEPAMKAEALSAVKAWAGLGHNPALPAALKELLTAADAPKEASVGGEALVAAGWGAVCRDLAPDLPGAGTPENSGSYRVDAETSRLDEALAGVRRSWSEKILEPAVEARAHFLAGLLFSQLARAKYQGTIDKVAEESAALPPDPATPPPSRPSRTVEIAPPAGPAAEVEFNPKAIYSRAAGAVVLILCASEDGSGELGTGSLILPSGLVLTNAHVVIRDSTRQPWPAVRLYRKPSRMTGDHAQDLQNPATGKVIAWNTPLDLALVQMQEHPDDLPALSLGDPEAVDVGDRVAAIGHPEQGGLWTLTTGVVSTVVADLGKVKGKNAFQTDASINRGNSGGPLLDASGRIIGVNTLMSRKAADGLAITSVNFAVKSDVARRWIEKNGHRLAFASVPRQVPPKEGDTASVMGDTAKAVSPTSAAAETPPPDPASYVVAAAPPTESREAASPPAAAKKVQITESRPYNRERLIEDEIKELEELEEEMKGEIQKRRGASKP